MRHTAQKLKLFASHPLVVLLLLTPVVVCSVAGKYFLNNTASATTNSTINFQARLMTNTGAIAADGDYNVEFKLYDALTSSGSSQGSCTGDTHCLWTETRTSTNVIHVANGYISANLGSVTGFPTTINWDQQLYLTMNIGGTGTPSWDGEMSPRLKLTAVPYAFRAAQLAALAGSNTGILQFAASLGQGTTITLPDPGATTATVCYQSSTACGFLVGAAGSYIQNTTTIQAPGNIAIRSGSTSAPTMLLQGASGQTADLLDLQNWNGTTGTNVFSVNKDGALTLSGTGSSTFTTPANKTVTTKINVPLYDPGNFNQIIALGIPNCTDPTDHTATCTSSSLASLSARGLMVADGRVNAHQPSLGVWSLDENNIIGFSWDGNSTNGYLKTTGSDIGILTTAGEVAHFNDTQISLGQNTTVSGTKTFTVNGGLSTLQGGLTANGGAVQLNVNSNNNTSINTGTSTGTVSIGNGAAGALSLQSGSTIAITTTNFNVSTAGVVTLAGAQTADITTANSAGGAANAVTIMPGTSGGASSNGAAVTIQGGNGSGTTSVTGGGLSLQGGNATGASGTRNGGSVTIDGGTGATANGSVSIGTANASAITIGSTSGGATITLGQSTATNTINIGSANFTAANTQTINIGNGSQTTASSTISVNILSGAAGNAGVGRVFIANNDRVQQVDIGNVASDGNRSLNLFTGNTIAGVTDTLNIGTGNAAGSKVIHIGDGTPSGSGVNTITVGSTALSSTTTIQGGTGSGAISIQAGTSGTISLGSTNVNTINIGNAGGTTTLTGTVKIATLGTATANAVTVCRDSSTNALISCDANTTGKPFLQGGNSFGAAALLGTNDANNLQVETNGVVRATFDTSNNLYLGNGTSAAAPNSTTITATASTTVGTAGGTITLQGGAGAATTTGSAGGGIVIQGGSGGGTASNGGNVTLQGGNAAGTGLKGLIQLNGATYFTTTTYSSGTSATITQSAVDSFSGILATATAGGLTFTVPSPTNTAASGRILYITNAGSNAFTLSFASSSLSLSAGATATLIWSGSAWTGAGVDSSTLQNGYNNSLGGTTPEILLDSTRKGLDVQDVNGGLGSSIPLFAVRAGAASGLGNSLLSVTNSNGNTGNALVGINTEVATRTLDVEVNNSTINGLPVLISQAGGGDTGLELKSPSKSFYVGLDASSNSSLKISSSTAGNASVTTGLTTQAPNLDTGSGNLVICQILTPAVSGTITSATMEYGAPIDGTNNKFRLALFTNNSGSPGTLLAQSAEGTVTAGFNTLPLSASVTGATSYFLCEQSNTATATNNNPYYQTGASSPVSIHSNSAYPAWPSTWSNGASITVTMFFTVTNSATDNFAVSLFNMTDTGQTTFQNSTDSTSAFAILNHAGTTLLGVDTTTAAPVVNLGVTGSTNQAATVNVGTSTGATQTINIGSASSGSAANGSTVLLQGGNTASAVKIESLASGTIGIGDNNAANTLQIGSSTLSSGTQTINIGNNNTAGGTTNITIGNGATASAGATTVQGKDSVTVNTNGVTRATFNNTNTLYFGNGVTASTPNSFTLQATGASAAATAGANLTLQGGTGNTTGAGGKVTIQGGTAGASGVKGLIELNGGTYFTTTTYSSGTSATITQSAVDSFSGILATATASGLTFTVPSPTTSTASGRILYITNAGSNAFTLSFASSSLSLSPGATATLIWSGSAWTGAGADASTLQNGYNNSLGGTTPEILLDSTRKGLDIQDANTSLGSTVPLLAVRASATASTLGNPLFVVENNAGAPLVGIGTATASRALDVAVSNSTVNGMPVLLEQAGTGDTGIEYKASGKNFYEGIDGTDGVFKISSASASNGTVVQGNNNPLGTDAGDDTNSNSSQATKLVASTTGTVSSISVYLNTAVGNVQVGIYSDSGAGTTPGTLLGSSASVAAVTGWNTLSISGGPSITSGTTYWLAVGTSGASHYKYASANTTAFDIGAYPLPTGTSWVSTVGNAGENIDIYASISTGITDEFAGTPLFKLTDTGQTTLQNSVNSNTAFQVLNLTGTTLLGVDTSTPAVNLGVTGTFTQSSAVNIGTSTGAAQTISIGGATSGSAANGTTVLLQGGNTASAVKIESLASGTIGIGDNNAANTLQIGSSTLSSGTQVINIGNNNTAGGTTNITIGTGSSATGGTTTLQGKTATNVTSSGAVTITAGASSTWSTTAGNISIQAGSSSGALNFTAGAATGATTAGAVTIQGGAASATAGSNGGGVTINGANGTATGTGGTGGTIILDAGNAQGTGNNNGGNIYMQLGAATGTGTQGTFQVQNTLGASLLTVDPSNTAASLNLISNGGAETGSPPTGWAAQGTGSSVATGTGTDAASGTQSAKVTFGTSANAGVKASFTTAPTASTTVNYIVSFSAKLVSGTAMSNTLQVVYSPDNGTTLTATCSNYSTQGLSTSSWTKVTCTFVPGSTTVTTALLIIRQTDAPGTSRVIDIDNLSVVQQNSSGSSNVGDLKVGGATSQGLTLLTLDTYAGTPFSGSNSSLAGSMYFDTTQGKIQCYDGSNWGACGAAPNNIITLSPEYAGAVLHQSGTSSIGTMTSDFCSGTTGININDGTSSQASICSSTQTFNFYRWTSPQSTAQQYSIWVTYQLPSTFKNFVNGTTTLTGRTDSTNSTVQYTIYKNVSGSSLTTCSASTSVSTGSQTNWQVVAPATDPSSCSFAAGNSIVIKIDVISSNNANAYVSNLNFAFSNQ